MLHHSFDKGLRKIAHPRRRRTEFPKIVNLFRSFAALEIAPEMILNRCFACSPSFAHKLALAKFRHHAGDFHSRPRGVGTAINSIFETALARLVLVIEAKHY